MSAYQRITYQYTQAEKHLYWKLSIGLQAVDGLTPSAYLIQQQEWEIAGEITLDEVQQNLKKYYELRESEANSAEKEADFSSVKINEYLRCAQFRLHPMVLKQIHKSIFDGLEGFEAGEYRKYNISKQEPILFGRSMRYEDYRNIEDYIEYDIRKELKKAESRQTLDAKELSDFIAGLWQIHPFHEGNTRTIAVFTIQYLNSLGFQIDNEPFAKHAAYFRDALVRACYNDMENRISPDFRYIIGFFEAMLYGKAYTFDSEELIVMELGDC